MEETDQTYTREEIQALHEDITRNLREMITSAQECEDSDELVDEINEEITFMNVMFNQIRRVV
jgi:uncharacterized coiled-coil DUF342 family protein